jgi:hypothetical protein
MGFKHFCRLRTGMQYLCSMVRCLLPVSMATTLVSWRPFFRMRSLSHITMSTQSRSEVNATIPQDTTGKHFPILLARVNADFVQRVRVTVYRWFPGELSWQTLGLAHIHPDFDHWGLSSTLGLSEQLHVRSPSTDVSVINSVTQVVPNTYAGLLAGRLIS